MGKPKVVGMRLLKQSQKGLARIVFSRSGLVAALLIFNIFLLYGFHQWLNALIPPQLFGSVALIFVVCMVLYLINSNMDPTAKITWLILVMLAPTVSAPLYFYVKSDLGHRALKRRVDQLVRRTQSALPQRASTLERFENEAKTEVPLQNYLKKVGNFPVYDQCEMTYFSCGEEKFEALKEQLRAAKRFIFLEYFIVDEGRMWGEVLEILVEKVKRGVDVRLMYDGSCEYMTLPRDYAERIRRLGIQCKVFSPATPFISTHYNYRDHRKIAVIDGQVAFTGGINLADEYINEYPKYGHWKDAAIMIRGEAVRSFTLMFLQLWSITERAPEITRYLIVHTPRTQHEKGYVIPYSDSPLDENRIGEMVYMDILNRAQNYVHIMSPYLILDGELETALCFAAKRGVEVSLILPGIPDKKYAFNLAKTHYKTLLDAGVKIYEYAPGFVHSKVFVSDDVRGVVGTINLDYRSLYHHFECGVYLYGCDCLADMERDFQETLKKCIRMTDNHLKELPLSQKLAGWVLKIFAPLF